MEPREKLLNDIKLSLVGKIDPNDASYVIDLITVKLNDYDISQRCTELMTNDDSDEILLKNYKGCLLVEGRSLKTVNAYSYTLNRLRTFAKRRLVDITTNDIRTWLATMRVAGKKTTYTSNQYIVVNTFYKWLMVEGVIEKNPCDPVRSIKVEKEEKYSFTDEDLDGLRMACNDDFERAMIEFLITSGVRIDELANMLIENVDLEAMTVHVKKGKGGKDRTTYINDVAKKYITKYLNLRKDNSPYLFISRNGTKFTTGGLRKRLVQIGERANVDNVHPHRFRRTLATNLARRGMPIQEIQKILGHTKISTTQGYINTVDDSVQASYRKFVA